MSYVIHFKASLAAVNTCFGSSLLFQFFCLLFFIIQMAKLLLVFLVVALLGLGSGEEGARLLASKSLLNRYAVEGRDLTLQYNIYNVGSRSDIWTLYIC